MKKTPYSLIDGVVVPVRVQNEMEYITAIHPFIKRTNLIKFLDHPIKAFGGMTCSEYMEKHDWDGESVERVSQVMRFKFVRTEGDAECN